MIVEVMVVLMAVTMVVTLAVVVAARGCKTAGEADIWAARPNKRRTPGFDNMMVTGEDF